MPEAEHYEPKQPPLPTLDELMLGKVRFFCQLLDLGKLFIPDLSSLCVSKVEERVKEEDEVDTRRGKVIKFGWIEGVLMRCVALPNRGVAWMRLQDCV